MKKLKQSSALLLIVSLLLSIFSLSVSALNGTAKITFHPRLLTTTEVDDSTKVKYDGGVQVNPPGQATDGIKYTLYRIADADAARDTLEKGNDIGVGDNQVDVGGKHIHYFGDSITKTLN